LDSRLNLDLPRPHLYIAAAGGGKARIKSCGRAGKPVWIEVPTSQGGRDAVKGERRFKGSEFGQRTDAVLEVGGDYKREFGRAKRLEDIVKIFACVLY
jgi:hypothetical protein